MRKYRHKQIMKILIRNKRKTDEIRRHESQFLLAGVEEVE
jgi:hypothetical protein